MVRVDEQEHGDRRQQIRGAVAWHVVDPSVHVEAISNDAPPEPVLKCSAHSAPVSQWMPSAGTDSTGPIYLFLFHVAGVLRRLKTAWSLMVRSHFAGAPS
jgi:hypothetical protein